MNGITDWKHDEYSYCVELVRTGGNANVPAKAMHSYLCCQIVSAKQSRRGDVVAALESLLARVECKHSQATFNAGAL